MSQNWTPPPPINTQPAIVPNNLVLAIIAAVVSLFFCCLPHGLISVIFATQVNGKAAAGDIEGAMRAAKNAKTWAFVSIGISIAGFVIGLAFGLLGAVMQSVTPR